MRTYNACLQSISAHRSTYRCRCLCNSVMYLFSANLGLERPMLCFFAKGMRPFMISVLSLVVSGKSPTFPAISVAFSRVRCFPMRTYNTCLESSSPPTRAYGFCMYLFSADLGLERPILCFFAKGMRPFMISVLSLVFLDS